MGYSGLLVNEVGNKLLNVKTSVLFALVFCCSLNGQTLWHGTEVGMSPAAVKKIFPEVHPFTLQNGGTLAKGESILKLDKTVIADETLNVHFNFKDDKLVHVDLWLQDCGPSIFEKFRDLLKTKYGDPYSFKASLSEYIWISGKTQVTLEFMDVANLLKITYETQHLEEADKL